MEEPGRLQSMRSQDSLMTEGTKAQPLWMKMLSKYIIYSSDFYIAGWIGRSYMSIVTALDLSCDRMDCVLPPLWMNGSCSKLLPASLHPVPSVFLFTHPSDLLLKLITCYTAGQHTVSLSPVICPCLITLLGDSILFGILMLVTQAAS